MRAGLSRVLLWIAPGLLLRRGWTRGADATGRAGERLALLHLKRRRWRVMARRLVTQHAEVDLVAWDGESLVCVEVKTGHRRGAFTPGNRLGPDQRRRLERAARQLARSCRASATRVDLIEVEVRAGNVTLEHHRGGRLPVLSPGDESLAADPSVPSGRGPRGPA